MPGDVWLRIPKPYELGVLAAAAERMIAQARGDKNAWDGYAGDVAKALSPVDEGAIAGPFKGLVEAMVNYDFFRGGNIIPTYEQNRDVALRKGAARGSRIGQALSALVGGVGGKDAKLDPRIVDHLIRSQFGGLGGLATGVSDIGRADRPGDATRYLSMLTGIVTGPPAFAAKDVQAAFRLSKSLGMENAAPVRALSSILTRYYRTEDPTQRRVLAARLRDYARRLRVRLEAVRRHKEA